MRRVLSLVLVAAILAISGCGGNSYVGERLDVAESLMESRPDSALAILNGIESFSLKEKSWKAKYALLKSMALDKNYVDTTTFEILQPAIDYYPENGTPDEKLRTYYYQGRIYQNRNERDSALQSFMRGLDIAGDCKDSLTIARTLVMQGMLYKSFYDYDGYTDNYQRAADIYAKKRYQWHEFDCLLNALNGNIILGRKEEADSIMLYLNEYEVLDNDQTHRLHNHRLVYTLNFGSKQDLKDLIENNNDGLHYGANGLLDLARAFGRLGENVKAIQQLEYLDDMKAQYDTLKYLAIKYPILEELGKDKEALSVYKNFSHRCELINANKFRQKNQSIQEKHQLELQTEKEAERIRKIIWGGISGLMFLAMGAIILMLLIRKNKIEKNLALQKVYAKEVENGKLKAENELALELTRVTEAENGKLKAENELVLEQARTAEAENGKLKAENELALQQARTAKAENGKLKAEKDLAEQNARAKEAENGKLMAEKELALEQARTAELEYENLKAEREKLALANENLRLERDNKALEAENLAHRVKDLEGESEDLRELLESQKEMPEEVRKAIQTRIEMLNAYLASQISDHKEFEKAYDDWVAEHTADTEEFMNSNRLAFQASHPAFIKYFEDHGLTLAEINYVCLYAIGLRGKDVGSYMRKRSHVNISSAIRKKLGIDKHDTNIGIYVRKKLQEL